MRAHHANDFRHFVVDYVYGRPIGEVNQEIGGVMVTLMILAEVCGMSVGRCEVAEVERILAVPIEHFQRRQREKVAAGI